MRYGNLACKRSDTRTPLRSRKRRSNAITNVVTVSQDKELVRRQLGEVVGEFAIFSDEPRRASVIAVGRVKALLLTRDKYMELYSKTVGTTLHVRVEPVAPARATGVGARMRR